MSNEEKYADIMCSIEQVASMFMESKGNLTDAIEFKMADINGMLRMALNVREDFLL